MPLATQINVTGNGNDRFAEDASAAMAYRASPSNPTIELSAGAAALANRPLWAIAAECLQRSGASNIDLYSDREEIARQAMELGQPGQRHTFFSQNEDRRYINAANASNRPGDFPNILSNLANKFLDSIELDDEFSFDQVSALTPNPLRDMKPSPMISMGVVDELDELQDAESLKDIGLEEEVLSYITVRRFGNRFGWTPVMIANDDLGAFAEGMIGLREAWQVTQNRLVIDRFTSNETLLDGYALFADRPANGSAANNNVRTGGDAPSDSEFDAMNEIYADIGGIGTSRRVRGQLNTILTPTGTTTSEATRTFAALNLIGEGKQAATTANVGLYRGKVNIVPDSELRASSKTTYYGLRNPTRLNTATIVRGYFAGYGTQGRRERWYDHETKTTYVSLEGRIGCAIKNWRYAVKNLR